MPDDLAFFYSRTVSVLLSFVIWFESQICGGLFEVLFGLSYISAGTDYDTVSLFGADTVVDLLPFLISS